MHMSDALVSPPVFVATGAVSLALLGVAAWKVKHAKNDRREADGDSERHRPADGRHGRIRLRRPDDQLFDSGHGVQRPFGRGHPAVGHTGTVGGADHAGFGAGDPVPGLRRRRVHGLGRQYPQHGRVLLSGGLSADLQAADETRCLAGTDSRRVGAGVGGRAGAGGCWL